LRSGVTCGLSIVEVIGVHAKILQHIVGNRAVDVLAIQIERNEHHPCPQSDPEIKLVLLLVFALLS